MVAGRIGQGQSNAPYVNPFGAGVLCNSKGTGQYSYGTTGQPAPDGFKQICAGSYCYQNGEPITVWRNSTYAPAFDSVYMYRLSPVSAPGSSVDVCYGSTTNGTCVQQYASWESDTQKFNILPSGNNWQIAMKVNSAKCVGPVGGMTMNGTAMESLG